MGRPVLGRIGRSGAGVLIIVAWGLLLAGCGSIPRGLRIEMPERPESVPTKAPMPPPVQPAPEESAMASPAELVCVEPATAMESLADASALIAETGDEAFSMVAQAPPAPGSLGAEEIEPEAYDPWERFNEKMFNLNLKLDRYILKPIARVYRKIIPEPFQILIANGFDNISWPPRFINNLLQGKVAGAGRELARFLINSTAGVGGLFDPAKDYWGIRPSKEDFGQTLGVWGAGPGPYLVLPLFGPTTVRDGVGRGIDTFLDPLSYFIPFAWDRAGMKAGDIVNDRALNYELFQGVEETTLDLYSSVRHFYLRRRELMIKE